jgi:hypothetical protein
VRTAWSRIQSHNVASSWGPNSVGSSPAAHDQRPGRGYPRRDRRRRARGRLRRAGPSRLRPRLGRGRDARPRIRARRDHPGCDRLRLHADVQPFAHPGNVVSQSADRVALAWGIAVAVTTEVDSDHPVARFQKPRQGSRKGAVARNAYGRARAAAHRDRHPRRPTRSHRGSAAPHVQHESWRSAVSASDQDRTGYRRPPLLRTAAVPRATRRSWQVRPRNRSAIATPIAYATQNELGPTVVARCDRSRLSRVQDSLRNQQWAKEEPT